MDWIKIVLDTFIILLCLYLIFFKSYFKEKGKNLATSEDIEDLTLKIESVKQQFIEKNATIKAKLDLLTNLQINHKNDERLALVDFHKKIKKWIRLLTEGLPSLIDEYNNEEIQNKDYTYQLAYNDVLEAKAVLELYVTDKKLFELISNLEICIIENLASNPRFYLIKLKVNNDLIKQLKKDNSYIDEYKELSNKRLVIHGEYKDIMLNGLKLILPLEVEYRAYVKDCLEKITIE